jgi:putative Mg2+ transporter-C (MgtC) family protein
LLPVEAGVRTLAVQAGDTLLRPLVNAINRAPVDEMRSEAMDELWALTRPDNVDAVRDLVVETLAAASYPVRDVEIAEPASEIIATLIATSVEGAELDAVCATRERSDLVSFANWVAQSGEAG